MCVCGCCSSREGRCLPAARVALASLESRLPPAAHYRCCKHAKDNATILQQHTINININTQQVGADVRELKQGDRVVVAFCICGCGGRCFFCKHGLFSSCAARCVLRWLGALLRRAAARNLLCFLFRGGR